MILLEYWKQPAASAEKFTANGWGQTGDLAKCDEDGYFWYQGAPTTSSRAAATASVHRRSKNCLLKHPAVANAAVIRCAGRNFAAPWSRPSSCCSRVAGR